MEDVSLAEWAVETTLDDARSPRAESPGAEIVESIMRRALAEQLAEQRLVRHALVDFDQRLADLERLIGDRLAGVGSPPDVDDAFQSSVERRLEAFEAVLRRVVDRLSGAEVRITDGLDHHDRVTRSHLESLRPALEATVERVATTVDEVADALARAIGRVADRVEGTDDVVRSRLDEAEGAVAEAVDRIVARTDHAVEAAAQAQADVAESVEELVARIEATTQEAIERAIAPIAARLDQAAEQLAHHERIVKAQIDTIRPLVETSITAALKPEVDGAVEHLRAAMADGERRLARRIDRAARAEAPARSPVVAGPSAEAASSPSEVPIEAVVTEPADLDLRDEPRPAPVAVSASRPPAVRADRVRDSAEDVGARRRPSRRARPLRARRDPEPGEG